MRLSAFWSRPRLTEPQDDVGSGYLNKAEAYAIFTEAATKRNRLMLRRNWLCVSFYARRISTFCRKSILIKKNCMTYIWRMHWKGTVQQHGGRVRVRSEGADERQRLRFGTEGTPSRWPDQKPEQFHSEEVAEWARVWGTDEYSAQCSTVQASRVQYRYCVKTAEKLHIKYGYKKELAIFLNISQSETSPFSQ